MTTLTTITARELKVSSNKSARTYTIKTESVKYRTFPMSRQEFNDCSHMTGQDWQNFLKGSDYYKI